MSDLATVLVAGLGAAAAFRAGDVSGGIAKKRDPVVRVAALSHLLSLAHTSSWPWRPGKPYRNLPTRRGETFIEGEILHPGSGIYPLKV